MKWPLRKRNAQLDTANEKLQQAQNRQPEVDALEATLRRLDRRNNFSSKMQHVMRGHPNT